MKSARGQRVQSHNGGNQESKGFRLYQSVNILILGRCIAFHSCSDDLDIAAAQDVTQRPLQIVNTDWIAGGGLNLSLSERIVLRHNAFDNQIFLLQGRDIVALGKDHRIFHRS